MPAKKAALLLIVMSAGAAGTATMGPGDPASLFASGFTNPCRTSFDATGDLYVVDTSVNSIYRVAPDGSISLFTDQIARPRGITFDPFGDLLVADPTEGRIYKVDGQGQATPFLDVLNGARPRVGPNGDIWVAAVDTVHHFDALGRLLESIDVRVQGGAARGLQFGPDGTLYLSNSASVWKLDGQTVVPVWLDRPLLSGSPNFDVQGNAYWTHSARDASDTHRVVLVDASFTLVNDTFASLAVNPCGLVFGRDQTGATTKRLFVSLNDGSIIELNPAGIMAAGVPEVGLSLRDLDESEVVNGILGEASELTADETYFLDVIGNDDGSWDVGDFRAYLAAIGVVQQETEPCP